MTGFIILLIVAAIIGFLWNFGVSTKKTFEKMENEAEDAYWLLEDAKKIIDEAEIKDEEPTSSN